MNEILVCSKCGACAEHDEDRTEADRCVHCGERETAVHEKGDTLRQEDRMAEAQDMVEEMKAKGE